MRRKRFQRGCLRKVKSRNRWRWIGKYYEKGGSRTKVLRYCAGMSEGTARAKLQEFLQPINEGAGFGQARPSNFCDYVLKIFVPRKREGWKESTELTTAERIRAHLLPAFEDCDLSDLTRDQMQQFLKEKVRSGLSRSFVDHLRRDLRSVLKMALDDGLVPRNPTGSLVIPKEARVSEKRGLSREEIVLAFSVLELRERIVFKLTVVVGLRPGEIFALRWACIALPQVEIRERVYRGRRNTPKSARGRRVVAVPPDLAAEIALWREISADVRPESLVFPSERGTFLSRDNFLRRNFRQKLETVGLGWVNFQVLRRSQASQGHKEGLDPKVAADQRGHSIGVALDTYTQSDFESRLAAVTKLEAGLKKSEEPTRGVTVAAPAGH